MHVLAATKQNSIILLMELTQVPDGSTLHTGL